MEINPPNHLRVNLSTSPTIRRSVLKPGIRGQCAIARQRDERVSWSPIDRGNLWPMAQQWNFNIQRELPGGILVEVGYYGNKFDHMLWQIRRKSRHSRARQCEFQPPLYFGVLVPGTPYTITLADVIRISEGRLQPLQRAAGQSGETLYQRPDIHRGLRLSKTHGSGRYHRRSESSRLGRGSRGFQPGHDPAFRGERRLCVALRKRQDLREQLEPVAQRRLGRMERRSHRHRGHGHAAQPHRERKSVQHRPTGVVGITDRPNVVGNWHLANPTVQEWFNTAAFVPNAKYTFGDAGRNILRGPGLVNLDLAAHKSFRITERISAQLRLESFNATNTPALGAPNTVVGNPLFGQITSAGAARDNQIGLKILF